MLTATYARKEKSMCDVHDHRVPPILPFSRKNVFLKQELVNV